jgi:allantoate deiminase
VAASDFVSAIHDAAKKVTDLRATIGALSLHPNVVNAIPRAVVLTLEIRALNDAVRDDFARLARSLGEATSDNRHVGFAMDRTYEQPAVPCNGDLIDALGTATSAICPTAPRLPSGATHDASAMADLCPISMLFVRCKQGVSHKPEEFAASDDMDAAIHAIAGFLRALEV